MSAFQVLRRWKVQKRVAIILSCLVLSVAGARAQDTATQQEVYQLKQRVAELENKQENTDDEFGKLSDIAKNVSIGGVLSGAYQYEWVDGLPGVDDSGRGANQACMKALRQVLFF